MARISITPAFFGIPEVAAALKIHKTEALDLLQKAVSDRARQTRIRLLYEMGEAYNTGTGRVARSINFRTFKRADGVELRFYIEHFRELHYMTSLFGGYFQLFPVRPFEIWPQNHPRLVMGRDVGTARVIVRLIPKGEPVLWGKHTGGFERDVLKEVSEEEAEVMVDDVMGAFRESVARLVAAGQIGGRR